MGKTARNDELRLRANFYNSVAVGLLLGGVALPYFSVALSPPLGVFNFVIDERGVNIDVDGGLLPSVSIVIALVASYLCRRRAHQFIAKVED